jgi:hypothetical protein
MAALPLAIVTQDDCDTCFQSGSLLPAAPETNFSPVAGGVSPGSPSDLSVSEAWQGIEFGFSILWFGHTA